MAQRPPEPPYVVITVDDELPSVGEYNRVIIGMRGWLQDHCVSSREGTDVISRPVLIRDTTNTNPRFRFVDIIFTRATNGTRNDVRVRFLQENVYALGFQVNEQQWREFEWDVDSTTGQRPRYLFDFVGTRRRDSQYITGNNGSYNGGMINYITLGIQGLRNALDTLIRESASSNPDFNRMAGGLGTFAIMFSEAARFDPILQIILRVFPDSPTLNGANRWIVDRAREWSDYSGWVLYYLDHPDEWRPLTIRMATDGLVATDVVVTTVHKMLDYMGILHNNPKKIHPR